MNHLDDLSGSSHRVTRLDPIASRRSFFSLRNPIRLAIAAVVMLAAGLPGCRSDLDEIREIQIKRETQLQSEARQDHLAEFHRLLEDFIELNPEKASRQIVYHLNQWSGSQSPTTQIATPTELLRTLSGVPVEGLRLRVDSPEFLGSDIEHLRDAYLFRQLVRWVDTPSHDDPLLRDWFDSLAGPSEVGSNEGRPDDAQLDETQLAELQTASRLFDWTVRNVALQPMRLGPPPGIDPPRLPDGLEFEGPGYRQTDFQTVFRGLGDPHQRSGVFTQLCLQAGLDAFLLATQSEQGELNPWAVGVLIGTQVYLFEPQLGTFIPGPDQVGIATLTQARRDESVMRRLSVPGFFDYPLTRGDVQQSLALLNVTPEAISPRMSKLEKSLTGDRRLRLHVDPVEWIPRLESVPGIAGVRWWNVPLLAEVYRSAISAVAARDPGLGFWYVSRWAILDSEMDSARTLAQGRWRHLQGRFADREMENEPGARTLYLKQRAPEFEIADLRIDVELQKQYGIRRELGVSPEIYDRQIQQVQDLMRMGKRTATYWLSLLQYDDGRHGTAENWFRRRVLDPTQPSPWEPSARYNLARTAEQLGEFERAVELYRTAGDPQEHGNRIRARLLARSGTDADTGKDAASDERTGADEEEDSVSDAVAKPDDNL